MTTIEVRREAFNLGRVVSRAFGALSRNIVTFLTLAILLYSLPQFLLAWLNIQTNPALAHMTAASAAAAPFAGLKPQALGLWLIRWVLSGLMQATIAYGVIADLNGRRASIAECLAAGFSVALPVAAIGLLFGLSTTIGMILLLVPGCLMATMWIAAVPAQVIERTGVFAAFARSRDLTRGNRGAVFSLMFVYWIAIAIVGWTVVLFVAGSPFSPGYYAAATKLPYLAASAILGAVTSTLGAAGMASIYFELRSIKEGAAPGVLAEVFD